MELAVPSHLKDHLTLIGDENDEYQVLGKIKCKCGCESFYIYESNERMIVKVLCSSCNKEILLFDEGKHGWNGYVCKDDYLNREEPFYVTKCSKCNDEKFEVKVKITSQGKQDFIDECDIENDKDSGFKEEDWVNAFEWITANIRCLSCEDEVENWLDCETM